MVYNITSKPFSKICPTSFRETCQWLKFPLNGLWAQSRLSPVVGLLPLASGPACLVVVVVWVLFSNPEHLVIWHLSCPVNAGLNEFSVMITQLPDVREMNDNSSFVSATNEVFVVEF